MTKLYGAPRCDETQEEIDFRGEWTWTAREEEFLLVDTGQNDQNHLVPFVTVGNLEKFYEAETIYIDRTFKANPVVLSTLQSTYCV